MEHVDDENFQKFSKIFFAPKHFFFIPGPKKSVFGPKKNLGGASPPPWAGFDFEKFGALAQKGNFGIFSRGTFVVNISWGGWGDTP
jgi:hypothetical protein